MNKIILAWGFVTFLYFKIAFDAAFNDGIAIIASLLLAMITSGFVFFASGIYAAKLFRYNAVPGKVQATIGEIVSKTVWPFVGLSVAYIIAARLIIFGFSKRLNREIRFLDYSDSIREEFIVFAIIMLIPVALHYAMCIYPTCFNANPKRANKKAVFDELFRNFRNFIDVKLSHLKEIIDSSNMAETMSRGHDIAAIKMAYMTSMLAQLKHNPRFMSTEECKTLRMIALTKVSALFKAEISSLGDIANKVENSPVEIAVKELTACDVAVSQVMKNFVSEAKSPLDPIFELIERELLLAGEVKSGESVQAHREKTYGAVFREMARHAGA
jgi:hypothetical protein